MKTSILLAVILAPMMLLAFTSCVTASDSDSGIPDYPTPNRADNAAKMQDAHSKFLRNQR